MDLPVIAAGAAAEFGLMAGLWVYAVRRENAGVVDIGWTAGMMIMAGACLVAVPA